MLVSMHELLKPTREHGFAIGAFNVADSCFIRAVVEEAEATNTPAIISIHPSEHDFVGDAFFSYVRDITQRSRVPFTLHLDHGASVEHVLRAIQCGFTSVMIDGSLLPYEENVALTREVVRLAHAVGVSVEGELGTIGQTGTSVEGGVSEVTYTDPAQAEDFRPYRRGYAGGSDWHRARYLSEGDAAGAADAHSARYRRASVDSAGAARRLG
jgi:fructose-bisphosphate aldolase class II